MFSRCTLWLLVVLLVFGVSSCKINKHLPEGRALMLRNKIDVNAVKDVSERDRLREDLAQIASPKPNKRFLGILPIRLWFYVSSNRGKETKFKWWVKNKIGEAPVLLDSAVVKKTEILMENYLWNLGYFENSVSYEVKEKKRRASVTYRIQPGEVWKIGTVRFPMGGTVSESIARVRMGNTLLKRDARFDVTTLKAERERIETDLRNNGFYFFSKEYVTFDLDTNVTAHSVDVRVKVNQPSDTADHKPFRVNRVLVFTDYEQGSGPALQMGYDTSSLKEFRFIHRKELFKKRVLRDAIFFREGELFTQDAYSKSLKRLNELGAFKFVSIDMQRSRRDTNLLNAFVYITPAKKQTLSGGVNLNHNFEGLTGFGFSGGYRNRNLARGADQLMIDVGLNFQLNFSRNRSRDVANDYLNTVDFTTDVTYYLNRLLVPFKTKIFSNTNPKTRLNARYNYEIRRDFPSNYPLYSAHNIGVTYGYEWSEKRYVRHYYNPSFLNFYFINKEDSFISFLSRRPALKRSYDEQIIWGGNYTFTFANQKSKYDKWYTFIRGNAELAGNILLLGFMAANDGYAPNRTFNIFNRPFSQYARFETDLRNYFRINRHSMFAMRNYFGIGIPYGNSVQLPYIKQFFVGGLNSLRGFQIREIGPGGYRDPAIDIENPGANQASLFIDQTGDIKIEWNMELRFDIYRWLKGATFIDAGNVWLIRQDDSRPNGLFEWNRFWREFGVNFGAGLRLDFNYFVIRLDYGVPIRDPRIFDDNKWTIRKGQFNLAIGYPF